MTQKKSAVLPSIHILSWNIREETRLFLKFLNHPDFSGHRRLILSAHPKIRAFLAAQPPKKALCEYLMDMCRKYNKAIKKAEQSAQRRMGETTRALRTLGEIMNYSWLKGCLYLASPTLLPFSPFENSKFYFSILAQARGRQGKDFGLVAIHEISHFVLFDILKKENIILPSASLHYLKETLTATLLNDNSLRATLGFKNYTGNPELRRIRVCYGDRSPVPLLKWLKIEFIESRSRGACFSDFLKKVALQFQGTASIWEQKKQLWNHCEKEKRKTLSFDRTYTAPIYFK